MSNIKEIAALIPARWRQENKFEEIKNGEHGDKIARYEFVDATNIHLQKRYEKLQEQLPKVEERIKQQEKELEGFRERYEKTEGIFKERLRAKDEVFKRLEKKTSVRPATGWFSWDDYKRKWMRGTFVSRNILLHCPSLRTEWGW